MRTRCVVSIDVRSGPPESWSPTRARTSGKNTTNKKHHGCYTRSKKKKRDASGRRAFETGAARRRFSAQTSEENLDAPGKRNTNLLRGKRERVGGSAEMPCRIRIDKDDWLIALSGALRRLRARGPLLDELLECRKQLRGRVYGRNGGSPAGTGEP